MERQRLSDGASDPQLTSSVGMHVVARVVHRQQPGGSLRIAQAEVEVDQGAATAGEPLAAQRRVHRQPSLFLREGLPDRASGGDGREGGRQAVAAVKRQRLVEQGQDLCGAPARAEVVRAQLDDDASQPGLGEEAVQAGQTIEDPNTPGRPSAPPVTPSFVTSSPAADRSSVHRW